MVEYSPKKFVWQLCAVIVSLGVLWKFPPLLVNRGYQADGYNFLNQALEILGDQNPEPDFCVKEGELPLEAKVFVEQAVESLEIAREVNANDSQTLLYLGRGYCLLGEFEEAVEAYQEFIRLRPGNPMGYLEVGFAYEEQNELISALKIWQEGNIVENNFLEAGKEALLAQKNKEALRWYQLVEAISPKDRKFFYEIGLAYEKLLGFDQALKIYTQGIDETNLLGQGVSSLYYRIGRIYLATGTPESLEQARVTFLMAIEKEDFLSDWEEADTHYQLGTILRRKEVEPELFVGEFEKAINIYPNHVFAHILLGVTYFELYSRIDMAENEILYALQIDPKNKWGYYHLGEIYQVQGNLTEAMKWYKHALELDPNFEAAQKNLSRLMEIYDE